MARYAWTPFESINLDRLCSNSRKAIGQLADLGKLANGDMLFISADSGPYSPYISGHKRTDRKLTASDLCESMFEAGLERKNASHSYTFKILACYAGLGMENRSGFAYDFWRIMTQTHGFMSLSVFSYTVAVTDPLNWGWPKGALDVRFDDEGNALFNEFGMIQVKELPGHAANYRVGVSPNGEFIGPKWWGVRTARAGGRRRRTMIGVHRP